MKKAATSVAAMAEQNIPTGDDFFGGGDFDNQEPQQVLHQPQKQFFVQKKT